MIKLAKMRRQRMHKMQLLLLLHRLQSSDLVVVTQPTFSTSILENKKVHPM